MRLDRARKADVEVEDEDLRTSEKGGTVRWFCNIRIRNCASCALTLVADPVFGVPSRLIYPRKQIAVEAESQMAHNPTSE